MLEDYLCQNLDENAQINLLSLGTDDNFSKIIPKRRRSEIYEPNLQVEPWDENEDSLLKLATKITDNNPKQNKKIKFRIPQSRQDTKIKQRGIRESQPLQIAILPQDRTNSCHAQTQFIDLGFETQSHNYKKIIDRIKSISPQKNIFHPQKQIKQAQQKKIIFRQYGVKENQQFSWSDYYKFIQKRHNIKILRQQVTNFPNGQSITPQKQFKIENTFMSTKYGKIYTKTIV